ncbi:putative lipase/esterase [Lachnospiraceae bacterium KM106-2]|nr:putative lipase/esterase [Lachnospiraceae bacterium KM106-2]
MYESNSFYKYNYGDHPSQFGILRLPDVEGKCPVVVTLHGGFWKDKYGLEQLTSLDEDLNKRGYATWNIEYRRIGETGGGWKGTFHDVVAAVNYLSQIGTKYQLDLERVVAVGHSAGGHLAFYLASRLKKGKQDQTEDILQIPLKGVISLAGVLNLEKMWQTDCCNHVNSSVFDLIGGTPTEFPERYHMASPIHRLPLNIHQVIIHGEEDQDVPIEISLDYYQKGIEFEDEIDLRIIPKADHFVLIEPQSEAWLTVVKSIEEIL